MPCDAAAGLYNEGEMIWQSLLLIAIAGSSLFIAPLLAEDFFIVPQVTFIRLCFGLPGVVGV